MRKRFKSKKKNNFNKLLLFIIIFLTSFNVGYKLIKDKIIKFFSEDNYLDNLIDTSFNSQIKYEDLLIPNATAPTFNESNNVTEPIIYIYNTHDEEKYEHNYINSYNISPNVKLASYYLQEQLKNEGIISIVEDRSIAKLLKENDWIYSRSYDASRIYLEDIKQRYPSIKYFIDLHRDSSVKEKTTTTYEGKDYAKILFIIGLEQDNYEANLEITNRLNEILKSNVPTISRGIYKKSGPGVNGIYNQDFDSNCILIEMGGQYNNIIEVSNTIELLAKSLKTLLEEYEKEE